LVRYTFSSGKRFADSFSQNFASCLQLISFLLEWCERDSPPPLLVLEMELIPRRLLGFNGGVPVLSRTVPSCILDWGLIFFFPFYGPPQPVGVLTIPLSFSPPVEISISRCFTIATPCPSPRVHLPCVPRSYLPPEIVGRGTGKLRLFPPFCTNRRLRMLVSPCSPLVFHCHAHSISI